MTRLSASYFRSNNALYLAEDLLGRTLVRDFGDGEIFRSKITETEAYLGFEDQANHASKGKTKRTSLMFEEGGTVYVYLIYGMYWLLNFVTGPADIPQAVLIRGVEEVSGPGRLGRRLKLDKSFYGEDLGKSKRLWVENSDLEGEILRGPRVGVDYAGEEWKNKPWRFILKSKESPSKNS